MIQLSDIVLGAVTAHKNGRHLLNDTRAAKRDLANLVSTKAQMPNYDTNKPTKGGRFNVWNFKPR